MKLIPKLTKIVHVNSLQRTSFKNSERKPVKKNWSLVPCTTGLSIKPLVEKVVVDKQWLQNKKAWMIKSIEEDSDNLKIKLKSEDIRMLTWNITTHLFSNVEIRRVISLLGRITPSEK